MNIVVSEVVVEAVEAFDRHLIRLSWTVLSVQMPDTREMEIAFEKSDTEELDVAEVSNTLEKAASDRKRRLLQMKAQMQNDDRAENEEEGPSVAKISAPKFRSYEPISASLGEKKDDVDLFIVEKEIGEHLADTEDTSVVEQVDISTLAPRKVDWDLKRDVAERMEKLERRTQRAIAELIRRRLAAGETELASAVNSGAYTAIQNDD
ncbi:Coiled-coil domain-containing protein 12 [Toxocara canis]|uniref:Coiled-coil domain-containing protein 12 n=1 Tax=Toxocara canis TaxID=6265 RepID=A0A0B2VW90_TOXCA|nr:Coiled-coil domain-containing protein 12 [Toxocara canis]